MATHPSYYCRGKTEVWDFIREQGLNYHLGCAIKYIARAGHKPDNTARKDLEKAIHYLQNELQSIILADDNGAGISDSLWFDQQFGEPGDQCEFDR